MRSYRSSITLLALLLLAMAPALHAQRGGRGRKPATGGSGRPVATINGQPIPYDFYRDAVDDQIRFQRRAGTAASVDALVADTIMLGLIDDELVRQEAARRRLAVNREEAIKLLLKDPPEFMRAPFIDTKGVFRREIFEAVIRDPSQIVRLLETSVERDSLVRQWKADLEKVILYVQSRENRRRLTDALVAEKPLEADDIRNRYYAENTKVIGSFIRVLHSTVPDTEVPISQTEARAWYDAHKNDYWAAPARLIGATILPIDPTPSDSAAHRVRLDSIRTLFRSTPPAAREALVTELQRMLPPDRIAGKSIKPSQLTAEMMKQLANARDGDVVGPFAQQNESVMLYVDRRTPTNDTVLRARHILVRVAAAGDTAAESDARTLVNVLRDSIDNESEFIEGVTYFSTDAGENKGDLGYFGRGRMLPAFENAAFSGPLNKVIGPIRTEHGYHLIWVNERVTDAFSVRELRVPLTVSDAARAAVARDAETLATALRTGVGGDSIVRSFKTRYPQMATDTTYIKRLERYGDVLAPARFAFESKVGDVAVLPLPFNRLMIMRVNGQWSGGAPEFGTFNHPEAHARRARQLDILGPRMQKIAGSMTPDMLIGPLRELAPDAEVFLLNDRTVTAPPDEEETILDSLVAVVPRNAVGGPVRGRHGYYFLRILEKNAPAPGAFERERATFTETYRQRYRNELLARTIADLRSHSTFVDLRVADAK